MIPPFAPDMVSDLPAATSTESALTGTVGRRAYLPLVEFYPASCSDRNIPRITGKSRSAIEMDPVAAPSRDKNRSRTFMLMSPALPKAKLSAVSSRPS